LFDRLNPDTSELVLFNVNRVDWLSNPLNLSFEQSVLPKLKRSDRPYRLTVLQNTSPTSQQLTMKFHSRGEINEQDGLRSMC
jgi:hypothetical protein